MTNALLVMLLATLPMSHINPANKPNQPAPEFPVVEATRWLNSPPLKMADLRGRVILLEVWTFM